VALSASRSAASLAITAQGSLSWEPPEG
jgi:hypothetical protein